MIVASLLVLTACSDASHTSVQLTITADPEVGQRASAVRLQVVAGHAPATRTLDETLSLEGREWPLRAVIVPQDGDATRPLDVTLEALDERARPVARIRAAPEFVPGRAREVELRFEAACLGVLQCTPGTTCVDGRCEPLLVEEPDAGVRDAGARDAGVRDAGVRDAGARDAGARDAGARDAGARDAGRPPERDAGPVCEERPTYADRDGDGWGDASDTIAACEPAAGRVLRAGDCDDACSECRPDGRETCDGARDEDCDSRVDEGCACRLGELRECEGGRDVCVRGVQTCLGERWSECAGRVESRREECNAVDDDCDGRIDEDLRQDCGGRRCRSTCVLGVWGPCLRDGDRCDRDDDDD